MRVFFTLRTGTACFSFFLTLHTCVFHEYIYFSLCALVFFAFSFVFFKSALVFLQKCIFFSLHTCVFSLKDTLGVCATVFLEKHAVRACAHLCFLKKSMKKQKTQVRKHKFLQNKLCLPPRFLGEGGEGVRSFTGISKSDRKK